MATHAKPPTYHKGRTLPFASKTMGTVFRFNASLSEAKGLVSGHHRLIEVTASKMFQQDNG